MILKVGFKLKCDLNHRGHSSILLHLDRLVAVKFSYDFISKGLSCLSMLMKAASTILFPNLFTIVGVMTLGLLVRKKVSIKKTFDICCIDNNPVRFLSNNRVAYCNDNNTV